MNLRPKKLLTLKTSQLHLTLDLREFHEASMMDIFDENNLNPENQTRTNS